MAIIKEMLREILLFLRLDLTKNLKYDRLTKEILNTYLHPDSNCIDVGCHKGEILDIILKKSPKGKHYAFEPIPHFFKELEIKFKNKATIFPYALSDANGNTTFKYVKNAPAYSGLKRRQYDIENPQIEEIEVELKTLDELIPKNEKISFIKIDVEGAEFGVLKGAENLLKSNRPMILFEFGKGASDFYGTTAADIYNFMTKTIGLEIYTLQSFIQQKKALDFSAFDNCFAHNTEYYFVAYFNEKS